MTTQHRKPPLPSICIVAHRAWGAMAGGRIGHAGGVEHQTTMLARWLAAQGYRVSLIVWSEGQPPDVMVDGVRVLSLCSRDAGIRGLRFVHPRWTSLWRALRAADADVYYQNCGEYVTGQVAHWCTRHARRFVFSVASDPECDSRLPALRTARDRIMYRYGLRHADERIVQTRRQQRMLRDHFGLDSIVLPMPCQSPDGSGLKGDYGAVPRFVWVGRISPEKRPDRLLDLARRMPDVQFDLVGDAPHDWGRTFLAGVSAPNVRIVGRVPRHRMGEVYLGACGLICTSEFEGFPNTFLEAWSLGVPVATLIDPDGLVGGRGLGIAASDLEELAHGVRRLATDVAFRLDASRRARSYFDSQHAAEHALPPFASVFLRVSGREPMHGAPTGAAPPEVPCRR